MNPRTRRLRRHRRQSRALWQAIKRRDAQWRAEHPQEAARLDAIAEVYESGLLPESLADPFELLALLDFPTIGGPEARP